MAVIGHTAAVAGILAVLQIILTFSVIFLRTNEKIAIGHGNNRLLEMRIRGHSNLVETVPMILILLGFIESNSWLPTWALTTLGRALIIGRFSHAYSFFYDHPKQFHLQFRKFGMIVTIFVMIIEAAVVLYHAALHL